MGSQMEAARAGQGALGSQIEASGCQIEIAIHETGITSFGFFVTFKNLNAKNKIIF